MVKDLRELGSELAAHDLIAALAGDSKARAVAGERGCEFDPQELDRTSPDNEFFVVDADSSQQCAVNAILNGQSGVIHGPPGTGKSQTIVNLIASMAASGKRVLFVAEKRAALNVVLERLKQVGLDHLAMDLHGADVSPKRVLEQVSRALDVVRASTPVDCTDVHSRTVDRRDRLDAHVERLHRKRNPASLSVFQMQGRLLVLQRTVAAKTRWRGTEIARLDTKAKNRISDLLREASGYSTLFLRTDASPWTGVQLKDGKEVQQAVDLVTSLDEQVLPHILEGFNSLSLEFGIELPKSLLDAKSVVQLLSEVRETLSKYSPAVYAEDPALLAEDLKPAISGWLSAAWAYSTSSRYRNARRLALGFRLEQAGSARVYWELLSASAELNQWGARAGESLPQVPPELSRRQLDLDSCLVRIEALQKILGRDLAGMGLSELTALISSLASDVTTSYSLPKLWSIETELNDFGAACLVAEFRASNAESDKWEPMLEFAWLSSMLDEASEEDPEIRGFRGRTHTRFVEEFASVDKKRIELASARVRRVHGERAVSVMNAHHDQELLIRAETRRTRKHLPLRRLFEEAGDVLTAVCPCWMASPLSVSQLLGGHRRHFDVVAFDEASQVLPEDAVSSILRAEKLVVAGDRNQLPPTTFFAAGEDDFETEEDVGATEGYESLLDLANSFLPSNYLDWHYRSRDESLISFSNHHIYRNRLITFPGPGGSPALSHVLVNQELGVDGEEESCAGEVRKVIELVLQHARIAPIRRSG